MRLRACGYQPLAITPRVYRVCLSWLRLLWLAGCTRVHLRGSREGTKQFRPLGFTVGRNRAPLSNVMNFTFLIHELIGGYGEANWKVRVRARFFRA